MNYKLQQTSEGPRWVKRKYNHETDETEDTPLPVGECITLDPKDFVKGSEVVVLAQPEPPTPENTKPFNFEELLKELESLPKKEFKPCAFYNLIGDFLQVYLKDQASVVYPAAPGQHNIELHKNPETGEIIGVNVWGVKKLLMESQYDA